MDLDPGGSLKARQRVKQVCVCVRVRAAHVGEGGEVERLDRLVAG